MTLSLRARGDGMTDGSGSALPAKSVTATIPIALGSADEVIAHRLVARLANGSITSEADQSATVQFEPS